MYYRPYFNYRQMYDERPAPFATANMGASIHSQPYMSPPYQSPYESFAKPQQPMSWPESNFQTSQQHMYQGWNGQPAPQGMHESLNGEPLPQGMHESLNGQPPPQGMHYGLNGQPPLQSMQSSQNMEQEANMLQTQQSTAPGQSFDLDKMLSTVGQLANTYHQVSPIVKQFGSLIKTFR